MTCVSLFMSLRLVESSISMTILSTFYEVWMTQADYWTRLKLPRVHGYRRHSFSKIMWRFEKGSRLPSA